MELNKDIAKGLATFVAKYEQLRCECTDTLDGLDRHTEILKGVVGSFNPGVIVNLRMDRGGNGCIIVKNKLGVAIYKFYFNNYKISEEEYEHL